MKRLLLFAVLLLSSCAPQIVKGVQLHDCTVYYFAGSPDAYWTECTGGK